MFYSYKRKVLYLQELYYIEYTLYPSNKKKWLVFVHSCYFGYLFYFYGFALLRLFRRVRGPPDRSEAGTAVDVNCISDNANFFIYSEITSVVKRIYTSFTGARLPLLVYIYIVHIHSKVHRYSR